MYDRTMKDALNDIQHGVEVGSIIFQMPEDEKAVAGIMVALKRQIPNKPNKSMYIGINGDFYDLCPNCGTNLCTTGLFANAKMNHCNDCGQRLDWK